MQMKVEKDFEQATEPPTLAATPWTALVKLRHSLSSPQSASLQPAKNCNVAIVGTHKMCGLKIQAGKPPFTVREELEHLKGELELFFVCLFVFLFRAEPVAQGSSPARG